MQQKFYNKLAFLFFIERLKSYSNLTLKKVKNGQTSVTFKAVARQKSSTLWNTNKPQLNTVCSFEILNQVKIEVLKQQQFAHIREINTTNRLTNY